MAEQVKPGTVAGLAGAEARLNHRPAASQAHETSHGRAVSWVAVTLITAGFLAGGLGLVLGPRWWLFWTGGAVAAVGGLLALATDIFEDWY